MAPVEVKDDYYAVLEISNIAILEDVTKSYRRLAKIRHPDKTLGKDDSTAAFQLLQNAYDTIRDPDKRRAYDIRWMGIRDHLQAQRESDKCQAEAAETARKRATEGRAKKQKEDDARQERLRSLEMFKSRYDSDIFELNRVVRKLTADFKRLQDQDDEDLRKERKRNSWWTYLSSPIYGKVNETDEQKQKRETERLHRLASKSIKRSELQGKEAKLQTLQDALQNVNSKIAAEKKKAEDEALAQARERRRKMDQEAREQAQREMRERTAKAQKEQAERTAKAARDAQAARAAQEAQERVWKAAAEERRSMEAEKRAEAMRAAAEAIRTGRQTREGWSKPAPPSHSSSGATGSTKSTCRHDRFWPKVEGMHRCSSCHDIQRRFAFQCPGCRMIACASCRQALRGEQRKSRGAGRRYAFDTEDTYDNDFP